MSDRYIAVNSEHFKAFLTSHGFAESIANNEVVFLKRFDAKPELVVKVYSSIRIGESVARDVGADAIRVVVVFDDGKKTFGVGKFSRVYRTGSQEKVEARTLERINEAFERCKEWCDKQQQSRPQPTSGEHVGKLGESIRMQLTVVERKPWNDKFLFTMKDDVGHVFTYWSDRDILQTGETYALRFKVQGHNVYRNVRQTNIVDVFGKRIVM